MDIAGASIDKPVYTWLIVVIAILGGLWGLMTVGRLEDPNFTIKTALVLTPYPGATAAEVEAEVTERIESAVQQLPQLEYVTSRSTPGMSQVEVEIQDTFDARSMPQVWDELRRKVADVQGTLPAGAGPSQVNDDFSDVFGIFYAVTATGFTDREVRDMATFLRRELLTVPGVAKVETAGEPTEAIYVEVAHERLAALGLSIDQVLQAFASESHVGQSGAITLADQRVRISPDPGFDTVASIEALRLGAPGSTEQISVADIATIRRDPVEIPDHLIWIDGRRAFTIGVSAVKSANVVEVGAAVDARLEALKQRLPLGVELHPIYEQHAVVSDAINGFILSLCLSVSIVIGMLCVFMGWRVGVVAGITLLLAVLGTIFFMRLFTIEIERISLGALILAMGMLVDNVIVVVEGMLVSMQRGLAARTAAQGAARRTQLPLLGATVIGIMAFSGIGLSDDITGEILFPLFFVIGVSLMLSWVFAITVAPMFGHMLLRVAGNGPQRDPYDKPFYRTYRHFLTLALQVRTLCVAGLVGFTALCVVLFGLVPKSFFAEANAPIFYLEYQLPQGADIRSTARDILDIETRVREQPEVVQVTGLVGRGASRFMLTYEPVQPDPSYGQLVIRTHHRHEIPPLIERLRREISPGYPQAQVRLKRIVFGPPSEASIEARFSGPSADTLRALAEEAIAILQHDGSTLEIRQNWRERELVIRPVFDEERARIAGVRRTDLAQALEFATRGVRAGTYREEDDQIPIVARPPAHERLDVTRLEDRLVWSPSEGVAVPVAQVVERFEHLAEDAVIHRRDRVRTLTVQAEPVPMLTADAARRRIARQVEAIALPPGYALEWGGEYEEANQAEASLFAELPIGLLVMLVISILLFGKVRQPLILWLLVPMSICGAAIGLLVSGLPFGFVALLGLISLWGMLMKNAIVLIDEIDRQIAEGKERYGALVDASVSRIRPVMLAAVTTILGMIPLLWDAMFANMAVTIMGGLAFATLLTLLAVPVLYSLFFRIRRGSDAPPGAAP
jgi:multidrug efflux pump subunit AcrB